jgi:hypothetical protein
MILNANLIFAEDQAVTATAISENVIQIPAAGTVPYEDAAIIRNLGAGSYLPLMIMVTADFATLTSLTISVETADNAALSSGAVVLATTGAIAAASLVAGYRVPAPQILPDATLKDYLGLRFTVGGSNATAGTITAALATEIQSA